MKRILMAILCLAFAPNVHAGVAPWCNAMAGKLGLADPSMIEIIKREKRKIPRGKGYVEIETIWYRITTKGTKNRLQNLGHTKLLRFFEKRAKTRGTTVNRELARLGEMTHRQIRGLETILRVGQANGGTDFNTIVELDPAILQELAALTGWLEKRVELDRNFGKLIHSTFRPHPRGPPSPTTRLSMPELLNYLHAACAAVDTVDPVGKKAKLIVQQNKDQKPTLFIKIDRNGVSEETRLSTHSRRRLSWFSGGKALVTPVRRTSRSWGSILVAAGQQRPAGLEAIATANGWVRQTKNGRQMANLHGHHIVQKSRPRVWKERVDGVRVRDFVPPDPAKIVFPKGWKANHKRAWYIGRSQQILAEAGVPLLENASDTARRANAGETLHNLTWAVQGGGTHSLQTMEAVYHRLHRVSKGLSPNAARKAIQEELTDIGQIFMNGRLPTPTGARALVRRESP